jgi:hypothetical protein
VKKKENVMNSLTRLLIGAAPLMVVGAASFVLAQTTGQQSPPMYDVKTEATVKGTIDSVETVTGAGARGRGAAGGMHLVLKTVAGTLQVHVGPTAYLAEKGIVLAKGDAVEILGSRVTIGGEPVLIARQIKKGDQTWTLRDPSGRPLWSGRGR